MNPFKSLRTAVACLILLIAAALLLGLFAAGDGPSNSQVRSVMEKRMMARIKGCAVTSMSMIRGDKFLLLAHQSNVPYGTMIYPISVKAVYTTAQRDGSRSATKEMARTLYLYKAPSGEWLNDDDLH